MKPLLFSVAIFLFACSKKHDDPIYTAPPIVVPADPDTLTAGWTKVGAIPAAETVSDIFFTDVSTGYITSDSGIYKSVDGGINWIKINNDLGFLNIGGKGSKACFVKGDSIMYNTQNYGASIQLRPYVVNIQGESTAPGFLDCYYSSDNVCYAASFKYIWKSLNGGITFDTLYDFRDGNDGAVTLEFANDLKGWTTRNYYLLGTSDGGNTWDTLKYLYNREAPISLVDENTGFISDYHGIFKTTDGGASWEYHNTFSDSLYIRDIDFVNLLTGYYCAGTYLYKTTDGGNSWSRVVSLGKKNIIEIYFLDEHHGWACGEYGYILRFNL